MAERLDALYDEARLETSRPTSDDMVEPVVVKTVEDTPTGATHWSRRSMAGDGDVGDHSGTDLARL